MGTKNLARSCLLITFFLITYSAQAQQPIPRIGYLSAPSLSASATRIEAFRQGLRELGYVEGKNIVIEWRSADGQSDRLRGLAAELVGLKVEIIVTVGGSATGAAKAATATIPIVTAQDPDPVGNRFVASLARPGGNITGLSTYAPELSGKRLEILKEVVPKLSRVTVLGTSTHPSYAQVLREIEPTAKALGVKLQSVDVLDSKDIEVAFRTAKTARADGLLTLNSPVLSSERRQLVALAVKKQLPVIYHQGRFVEEGGFVYYGVNLLELDRRSAQDFERCETGTSACGAAAEVRVHHQSESRQSNRPDDSAERAGASKSGD